MKSVYIFNVLFLCNGWPLFITLASLARVLFKKVNNTASNCLLLTIETACNNLYSFNNVFCCIVFVVVFVFVLYCICICIVFVLYCIVFVLTSVFLINIASSKIGKNSDLISPSHVT